MTSSKFQALGHKGDIQVVALSRHPRRAEPCKALFGPRAGLEHKMITRSHRWFSIRFHWRMPLFQRWTWMNSSVCLRLGHYLATFAYSKVPRARSMFDRCLLEIANVGSAYISINICGNMECLSNLDEMLRNTAFGKGKHHGQPSANTVLTFISYSTVIYSYAYSIIWYDMIWYNRIQYTMIWYDMIWYDIMIWYDMI